VINLNSLLDDRCSSWQTSPSWKRCWKSTVSKWYFDVCEKSHTRLNQYRFCNHWRTGKYH